MTSDAYRKSIRPKIVILTPVCNEEENLREYEKTVSEILFTRNEYDFIILFIDDGSTDRSWSMIREISARDPRFSGIRLSRNYGSDIALTAGFAHGEGDAVAVMSCDLQDPPEVILEFLKKWKTGAKIVWGTRRLSRDKGLKRIINRLFYEFMHRFSVPKGTMFATGSFFLVDRTVADCYRQFPERNRITYALIAHTGFEQEVVIYTRKPRMAGKTKWTFAKKLKALYDAFFGYSLMPVRLITLFGAGNFLLAIVLSVYTLYCRFTSNPVEGYTSIMLGISFFFGIQFLLFGFLGEYLYRIYSEVVRRPLFFISEKTGDSESTEPK